MCELLTPCTTGYRRGSNGSCIDVDECQEGSHSCSRASHRYCVNQEGGYECVTRLPPCPRGYEFSILAGDCEDVDECISGRAKCEERCINLPGRYKCERSVPKLKVSLRIPACPAGFNYDLSRRKCTKKEPDQ